MRFAFVIKHDCLQLSPVVPARLHIGVRLKPVLDKIALDAAAQNLLTWALRMLPRRSAKGFRPARRRDGTAGALQTRLRSYRQGPRQERKEN